MRYTPEQDVQALIDLCQRFGTKRLLEIGCNRGETMLALSERFPDLYMVGVDPGDYVPPLERAPTQFAEYLPAHRVGELVIDRPNVRIYRCRSRQFFAAAFAEPLFDGVFIDGDHRQAAVEHDTRLATRLLRPGGFIAWHDCDNEALGVVHALRALAIPALQVPGTWLAWWRP